MRRLIVGDIHGCQEEFNELLHKAALSADDQVIALGDIVDRGPQSPAVLERFMAGGTMRSLLGNHERKHLRWYGNELKPALSQRITKHQLGDDCHRQACHFFSSLPAYIELDEAILVHGYLDPFLPLAEQHVAVLTGTLSGAAYLQEKYERPWYELWQGEKPVLVGHCDYSKKNEPTVLGEKVFSLDTNCCRGGALSALLLPEFRFISVKARRNHYEHLMEDFLDFRLEERHNDDLKWDRIERLLSLPKRRNLIMPATMERLHELRVLQRECDFLLAEIEDEVMGQTEVALAKLRENYDCEELDARELSQAFAQIVSQSLLAPFLHRARLGKFNRQELKRRCSTPGKLKSFASLVVKNETE